MKKHKMLMDNGVNPNPFSCLDDSSRRSAAMSENGDFPNKDHNLTGQLNSYFRKRMNINLNGQGHSVFTPPK